MASSQLEIVSSSPFGCVLRDHNRKERCRDSNVRNVQSVFDKNFNDLVRDHINGVASWVTGEQANADATANPHSLRFSNKTHHHENKKNDVPSASTIIPRPPPVLDRWFTRQSDDVPLSTSDKHVNEAAEQLLAPSQSHSNTAAPTTSMPSASTTKTPHNSPAQSENASAKHNHGASSLVQRWEAWLHRSNSINSNQNQSQSMDSNTSRTSSGVSSNENNAMEQPSARGPFDEKIVNRTNNADSLIDRELQSDRTAAGKAVCSSCSRTAGVTEKVSIVDIIKKLKNGVEDADHHEHSNNDHKHCSTADQAEQRCFSLATNVPRLRWRHAVHDLLIHREQDKNRELDSLGKRQNVSKFPQRGRLQSMLKIRSLQRFQIIQDRCRPQLPEAHLNRLQQPSNITHRREKFSACTDPLTTPQNVSATSRCSQKDKKFIGNGKLQEREDTHCQKGDQSSWPVNRLTTNENEYSHEQAKPLSDAIQQKTRCPESLAIAKATTPLEGQSQNEVANKQGSNSQQHLFLGSQETAEAVTRNEVAKAEKEKDQHHLSLGPQETAETLTSLKSRVENEIGEEEGDGNEQHPGLDSQSPDIVERSSAASYNNDSNENEIGEEEGNGNQRLDSQSQDIVERSSAASYNNDNNENGETEEEEDYFQQCFNETNDYDWFSNISRPKSYWESLRKAWYQEVLTTALKNGDIRELVERGRVSTLLKSDFRESMDRLLTSRIQMQPDGTESQQDVEDTDGTICRGRISTLLGSDFRERMNRIMTCRVQIQAGSESQQEVEGKEETVQPMCCPQKNLHPAGDQGEEEEEVYDDGDYDEDEDEDEEERSLSSHQCHEANNYFDHSSSSLQMPSLSALVMRSWISQEDKQTGNDYERRESVFSPPPQPSQVQCYQDARQSSSTNRPSLEIELICDLRRHIEQLQREMSELRKSIVSCTDMQMKMQHYTFNRKVHSVEVEAKISEDTIPWKRTCCICRDMQVDSLLYRCGHMCTCLKCGNELQWSSGKCPVCLAPILDIVPAK